MQKRHYQITLALLLVSSFAYGIHSFFTENPMWLHMAFMDAGGVVFWRVVWCSRKCIPVWAVGCVGVCLVAASLLPLMALDERHELVEDARQVRIGMTVAEMEQVMANHSPIKSESRISPDTVYLFTAPFRRNARGYQPWVNITVRDGRVADKEIHVSP
ncbi:MAG: hypothetical protein OHK0029_27580 [Armatimonadaceae bacterium]